MKAKAPNGKAIYDHCKKRGYIEHAGTLYPPTQAAELNIKPTTRKSRVVHNKTGWIDDTRNIANKAKQTDIFITLIKQELQIELWPEFFFSIQREFRFDYAIPQFKIAIEVNGGIWSKGNSGHSSGTGIRRDMDKSNLAQANGWRVISIEPDERLSLKTLELIKKIINHN